MMGPLRAFFFLPEGGEWGGGGSLAQSEAEKKVFCTFNFRLTEPSTKERGSTSSTDEHFQVK